MTESLNENRVSDSKQSVEIITAEDRRRITDIVFVLEMFSANHLNKAHYPSKGNIATLIQNIDVGNDKFFPAGTTRAEIAKSFLQEFAKIETKGGSDTVQNCRGTLIHYLRVRLLPVFNLNWKPERFTEEQLVEARIAITNACNLLDQATLNSARTKFTKAFYVAMGQNPTVPPKSSRCSFWKQLAATLTIEALIVGLTFEHQYDWVATTTIWHGITNRPEISAPVGAFLFLALVAGCYAYCKSKAVGEGNQLANVHTV